MKEGKRVKSRNVICYQARNKHGAGKAVGMIDLSRRLIESCSFFKRDFERKMINDVTP